MSNTLTTTPDGAKDTIPVTVYSSANEGGHMASIHANLRGFADAKTVKVSAEIWEALQALPPDKDAIQNFIEEHLLSMEEVKVH